MWQDFGVPESAHAQPMSTSWKKLFQDACDAHEPDEPDDDSSSDDMSDAPQPKRSRVEEPPENVAQVAHVAQVPAAELEEERVRRMGAEEALNAAIAKSNDATAAETEERQAKEQAVAENHRLRAELDAVNQDIEQRNAERADVVEQVAALQESEQAISNERDALAKECDELKEAAGKETQQLAQLTAQVAEFKAAADVANVQGVDVVEVVEVVHGHAPAEQQPEQDSEASVTTVVRKALAVAPAAQSTLYARYDFLNVQQCVEASKHLLEASEDGCCLNSTQLVASGMQLEVSDWMGEDSNYRPRNVQELEKMFPGSSVNGVAIQARSKLPGSGKLVDSNGTSLSFPHTWRNEGGAIKCFLWNRDRSGVVTLNAKIKNFDMSRMRSHVDQIEREVNGRPLNTPLSFGLIIVEHTDQGSITPLQCSPNGDDSSLFMNTNSFCAPVYPEPWHAFDYARGRSVQHKHNSSIYSEHAHFIKESYGDKCKLVNQLTGDSRIPFVQMVVSTLSDTGKLCFQFKFNDDLSKHRRRDQNASMSFYLFSTNPSLRHVAQLSTHSRPFQILKGIARGTNDFNSSAPMTATRVTTP